MLNKIEDADERTKKAMELKKKGLEIAELGDEVKTQEEFAEELKVVLSGVRLGLEDTKLYCRDDNERTKLFIEIMEEKLVRIEKDFKEGNKTPEQLLKELRDRSDVDYIYENYKEG